MKVNGVKFRYINGQCYEFILPSGKHLLLDPYISDQTLPGFREFKIDEIERCDYVLLTHSHWDHTSDLGNVCNRFDSKLFCGAPVAAELSEYFKIKPGRIYPFENMDVYETEDFTLSLIPISGQILWEMEHVWNCRYVSEEAVEIVQMCIRDSRWGMVGSQIMVTIMGNNLLVEPEEVCYNGGS